MGGEAVRRELRRRILLAVLLLLALPGLVLLVVDLVRLSPREVAERVAEWRPPTSEAAGRFGVPPDLVLAVIAAESRGDPEARSGRGALGLMQLIPATARERALRLGLPEPADDDLFDPELNILLGTAYLKEQMDRFGDVSLALAAYNAGPARVEAWIRSWPGRPPEELIERSGFSETRAYVSNVLAYRRLLEGGSE